MEPRCALQAVKRTRVGMDKNSVSPKLPVIGLLPALVAMGQLMVLRAATMELISAMSVVALRRPEFAGRVVTVACACQPATFSPMQQKAKMQAE